MKLKTLLTALGVNSAAERKPVEPAGTTGGTTVTGDTVLKMESKMAIDIKGLGEIAGFIGACLVDSETGLMMAAEGGGNGFDLENAAAGNTEVVKAKRNAMKLLGLKDNIEDILITLGKQYHLIRPMEKSPSVFIYVALDRKAANLGMARVQVKNVEQSISF
jgi:predicted regulator of Ras-like GTPase activity (Roadblock/LC7/MglB family)